MGRKKHTKLLIFLSMLFTVLFACSNKKEVESVAAVETTNDSKQDDIDLIKFGKFEQDGNESNGKESIEWIILEDTGEDRLLISKDVLYALPFDDKVFSKENNQDWEKSSLRKWLNEDFFDVAFDDEEKKFVIDSYVKNGKIFGINNSDEPSSMGADTNDKVYILSKDEMRKYLSFESEGGSEKYLAKASNYARKILDEEKSKEKIAVWHKEQDYDTKDDAYTEYWLRSTIGYTLMSAKEYFTDIVDKKGHISNHGFPYYVSKTDKSDNSTKERFYNRGVRPVIRIAGSFKEKQSEVTKIEESPKIYDIKDIYKAHTVKSYALHKNYKDFDSVVLGSYEQDGDIANGKEGIEWLVLKKENSRALLMSKYILDYVEYSNILGKYTVWKDSRLRAWANHEFYDSSFNEQEKVLLASTKIKNYDNPVYGNTSGAMTIDKVFAPGFDELIETFEIDYDDCMREPYYDQKTIDDYRLLTVYTDYALKKYRKEKSNHKADPLVDFWLRNQGRSGESVNSRTSNAMIARQTIDFKGSAYDVFQYSSNSEKTISSNPKLGFRPCLWIDLNVLNEFDGTSYDAKTDKIFSEDMPEAKKYSFENINEARVVSSYNNKATIANYDTVTFGTYEQDGDIDNGKENIEWLVLDKNDGEYLLLSKFVLDYHPFHNNKLEGVSMSWNNSDIRLWANSDFIDAAFSEEEKKQILQSSVENTINDYYNLRSTEDKVFLLSIDEIAKYFGSKNENYDGSTVENFVNINNRAITFATNFAKSRGVIIGGGSKLFADENLYSCAYYTRSMRNSIYNQVIYIKENGADSYAGAADAWKRFGFRPAIWVSSK